MAGHDAVVHFAAESHVDRSIVDPDTFVRTNCLGTNVLCDVARHVEVERFLHISTDEVYGSIEDGSFVETDRLGPRSPYSSSKAGSDLIALSYEETYGLPVLVTRSSNNFGPYQFPEKVIPLFVTNLLDGRKVPLYGDGLNIRDWIYVEDNCAGRRPGAAQGRDRRGLQHRWRQRDHQPRAHRDGARPLRCRRRDDRVRRRTASATTAATRSTAPRPTRSGGPRPAPSTRRSPPRSSGTGTTGAWWEPLKG